MARTTPTNTFKTQTQPALLNVLVRLVEAGTASSAADLDTTSIYMGRLVGEGLVKIKEARKHTDENGNPKRGRPYHLYAPTDKGRKRARRALAKREQVTA